jgi:hypothetical protein
MSKQVFFAIQLLLGSQVVAAQGAFTIVNSPAYYYSATVITIDEEGKRTERVFAAKHGVITRDSVLYQAYSAYTSQLAREGYRQQSLATGTGFIELTYIKEQTTGKRRKRH